MSRKILRYFTDDFKQQIVDLHNAGRRHRTFLGSPIRLYYVVYYFLNKFLTLVPPKLINPFLVLELVG